jgi:hypothetical protein
MNMSLTRIMYIEQKTEGGCSLNDRGPAEVGEVTFSRTGTTIYYKGKTFRRAKSIGYRKTGIAGNYICVEDGDEYWISGVKRRGSNRHPAGSGPVVDATTSGRPAQRKEKTQDKSQLFDALRSSLLTAGANFLKAIQKEFPELKLRYFLLERYEQQAEVRARVITDQGFIHSFQEKGNMRYRVEAEDPVANLSQYFRWGWDGGYQDPEPMFAKVIELLRQGRGHGMIQPFDGSLNELCLDVLRQMDEAGAFGTGEEREEVIIGVSDMLGFDNTKEFVDGAKRVNPPQAIRRLRRELKNDH